MKNRFIYLKLLILLIVLILSLTKINNPLLAAQQPDELFDKDWHKVKEYKMPGLNVEEEIKAFILQHLPEFKAPVSIQEWQNNISKLREIALQNIYLRGYASDIFTRKPNIVWGEVLNPDSSYIIRKLRYEIYPNYWIPALLYEPSKLIDKVPVVLNPNGHHSGGKAAYYKQIRCINLAKRNMIALSFEFIGMGELQADANHNNTAYLNLTGLSSVGFFYLAMKNGLDILLDHEHADPNRVAMTGLSGGGWQTIVLSALDPRISLSVPNAGYTSIHNRVNYQEDIGDLEQIPVDFATILDYQDLTAMLAPRPALLILNDQDDCCFPTGRTRPVIYDAVLPVYEAFGVLECFKTYNNRVPGIHNYGTDNRSQLYRFLNIHFNLNTQQNDLHRTAEILSEQDLNVGLPLEQETIQHIAMIRARELASNKILPKTRKQKEQLRKEVANVIKLTQFEIDYQNKKRIGSVECVALKIGPFTVPFFATKPENANQTILVLADQGARYVSNNKLGLNKISEHNVFKADIFGTGENKYNFQYQMLVEAVGSRLLGIQVSQTLSCAKEAIRQTDVRKIDLFVHGMTSSIVAIIAAAIEPELFDNLFIYNSNLNSFKLLIEKQIKYEKVPSLFCFGFLKISDIPQLITLMDGITIHWPDRGLAPVHIE